MWKFIGTFCVPERNLFYPGQPKSRLVSENSGRVATLDLFFFFLMPFSKARLFWYFEMVNPHGKFHRKARVTKFSQYIHTYRQADRQADVIARRSTTVLRKGLSQ